MSRTDAELRVGVVADTVGLGTGLAQAEAQVRQSASNMGSVIDRQMGKFGTQIQTMLARGLGAGVAIHLADGLIRGVAEAIRDQRDIPTAVVESLQNAFRSVPIGGALMDALLMTGTGDTLGEMFIRQFVDQANAIRASRGAGPFMTYSSEDNRMLRADRQAQIDLLRSGMQVDPLQVELEKVAKSGLAQVDTAIGRFTTGGMDPVQVNKDMLVVAREQRDTLDRIESLMQELGQTVRTSN